MRPRRLYSVVSRSPRFLVYTPGGAPPGFGCDACRSIGWVGNAAGAWPSTSARRRRRRARMVELDAVGRGRDGGRSRCRPRRVPLRPVGRSTRAVAGERRSQKGTDAAASGKHAAPVRGGSRAAVLGRGARPAGVARPGRAPSRPARPTAPARRCRSRRRSWRLSPEPPPRGCGGAAKAKPGDSAGSPRTYAQPTPFRPTGEATSRPRTCASPVPPEDLWWRMEHWGRRRARRAHMAAGRAAAPRRAQGGQAPDRRVFGDRDDSGVPER